MKSKYLLKSVFLVVALFSTWNAVTSKTVAQETVQTGSFTLEKSIKDLLGNDTSQDDYDWINIDEPLKWEVNVPTNYDVGNPPGILVYVSPQDKINIPSRWMSVTDKKNLIWVAALNSGNKVPANERIMKAILALELVQSNYRINPNRVFITGFSGGGRVASLAATYYPEIFKGALYICGANFWSQQDTEKVEHIKKNRFVFLTGTRDFNLDDTKSIYGKYKRAGVENLKLMVINRMGHSNPKRNKFEEALHYLDENNIN